MSNKYSQVDIWWCAKCHINWMAPSVPHRPECPRCGDGGWWRRFATAKEISEARLQPVDNQPQTFSEAVIRKA